MGELVKISIDTERYPAMMGESEDGFEVPRALLDARYAALDSLDAVEAAIMEHVAERHPDARFAAEWLAERAERLAEHAAKV